MNGLKIKELPGYIRDPRTGAIVCNDAAMISAAKESAKRRDAKQKEFNEMKQKLEKLQLMLDTAL